MKWSSKKEATRKAFKIDCELAEGTYQPSRKSPGIEMVTAAYVAHLQTDGKAKRTIANFNLVIRRVLALAEARKVRTIADINLPFVDAYRAQRAAEGAKPKTLLNETVILRQIVNFALERNIITADPLRKLKRFKVTPMPQPYWDREGMDKIVALAEAPYKAALIVLAETGMRIGEAQHLTWDNIDFALGLIHIRAKAGWRPKTVAWRAVPMTPAVREVLDALPRRSKWVLTSPRSKKYPQGNKQVSDRRLLVYLKKLLSKLALKGHVHTFRHSFISHALTSGIPEAVVRSWVGHVDAEILKLYTHISSTASKEAMQRLAVETERNRQERNDAARKEAAKNGDGVSARSQHNDLEKQNEESAK
jgi:integrase